MKKKYIPLYQLYIKNRVKEIKKEFLKEHSLPNIPIYYIKSGQSSFKYNYDGTPKRITINPHEAFFKSTIKPKKMFKYIKINSVRKRIDFIILHELSHYLHFSKYKNSYFIEKKSKEKIRLTEKFKENREKNYRGLPLEKKADKIALYSIKENKNI
jgi:hypothetical protein